MAALYSRVTVVRPDGAETIYKEKRKKKKVSGWLRPLERAMRGSLRANEVFNSEALRLQKRSNRKRRNGWLRDLGLNLVQANRKAMREFQ